MKAIKFPLIPITLTFCLGIVFHIYWRLPLISSAAIAFAAISVFGLFYWQSGKQLVQRNFFGFAVYAAAFSLGILSHSLQYQPGFKNHYSHFVSEKNLIHGVISERLKPNAYSEKYYLTITELNGHQVFGKILLNLPRKTQLKPFHSGERLLISSDIMVVPPKMNPYQFDYAAYLEKQNVFHQLHLKTGNYKQLGTQRNFDYYVEKYREALLKSFDIHHFTHETKSIIYALLLGQRQDMATETAAEYTNAGVIHILAISGLHIAILYGILLTLLKPLENFRKGKLLQFLLILFFLWAFAMLSGLSASVVRSVVMFSFISLGLYLNKTGNIYNTLAISMLAILTFRPNMLFDVGFQLSYLAVFSIVWLQPLYKSVTLSRFRLVNYFIDTLTISFAAQVGVLPLSLYYFNQFPLLFLLANVVVIPLSTFVLLLGIVVLLFNFILPEIAIVLGKVLSYAIEIMNTYISWVASFEDFLIRDIPFSFWLLLLSYAALAALIHWWYKKKVNRLILFLSTAMAFQLMLLGSLWRAKQGSELLVYNNKKAALITEQMDDTIYVYTNDESGLQNSNLKAYKRGKFNLPLKALPFRNTLAFASKKILVIDSLGIYALGKSPDIILLTQSPKVNLTRVIQQLHPQQIIADGTNYKSFVKRWKATCKNEKIPFHATAEKGFHLIEN